MLEGWKHWSGQDPTTETRRVFWHRWEDGGQIWRNGGGEEGGGASMPDTRIGQDGQEMQGRFPAPDPGLGTVYPISHSTPIPRSPETQSHRAREPVGLERSRSQGAEWGITPCSCTHIPSSLSASWFFSPFPPHTPYMASCFGLVPEAFCLGFFLGSPLNPTVRDSPLL